MRELGSFVRAHRRYNPSGRGSFAGFFLVGSPLLIALVFVATAFSGSPQAPVVLPIELLGPDGHTVSVSVDVPNSSDINRLWIQGNAVGFIYSNANKASVRVNGGSWVQLNNSRVTCDYPDSNYGCVESGLGTIRFSVPISGVRNGSNSIDFRFDGTDGMSVGWRVLDFNFLRSNGSKVLPSTAFVQDDRSAWQPPRPAASEIAEGKRLWETAQLTDSPINSSHVLRATCADCHDQSGADLKYFSYSNKSIIARSVFHGLSEADGERIASYIRSLDVEAYGTPWDPPYQPGPGLDSKPSAAFAAGAGLDWVLDLDSDMIPYVFPTSNRTAITDTKATLNVREIPTAIQMPTWNAWLPRIHPLDAYGSSFTSSAGYRKWTTDLPAAMAGYPESKTLEQTNIESVMEAVNHYTLDWGIPWSEVSSRARADAEIGLRQWKLVKMWEFVHKHHLHDKADELHPRDSEGREHGEIRGWPGITPFAFNVAPHRIVAQSAGLGPYRDENVNLYFSTVWYQLQLLLNPGWREASEQNVVDWKYHMPHIIDVDSKTQHPQTMRKMVSLIKLFQMIDNPFGANYSRGWQWRVGNPAQVWWQERGMTNNPGQLTQTQFKDVVEPMMESWITKTEEFVPDDWCRDVGLLCLTPSSYVPEPFTGNGYFLNNIEQASAMYRLVGALDGIGVDSAVLERMATWFQDAWPRADWHSLYSSNNTSNSAPTVSLTSPQNNASFEVNSQVSIKANATDADGSVSKVEFFVGSTRVSTDTSSPYEYNWSANSTGSFVLTAKATDNLGSVTTSAARTVSITASAPQETTHTIPLQQGWNLVSSYVRPTTGDMDAVFSSIKSEILLVKNQSGAQYHPPSGLNTIGGWDVTEAYEVYSNTPQSLQITGTQSSPTTSISMSAGWNHLAFTKTSGMPIEHALSAIGAKVNIVKDASGKVYYPQYSINEIDNMLPGQGYKVHLSESATLTYPSSSSKGSGFAGIASSAVASSAVLIVEADELPEGTLVTVASAVSGMVAGEGVVTEGRALIHLSGDDAFTDGVREGVREGDVLVMSMIGPGGSELQNISVSSIKDGLDGSFVTDGAIRYTKDAVLIAAVAEIPASIELDQNFPNPFDSTTSIRYTLPEDSHVILDVYNIAGQKVARLVDGDQPAGWHSVQFDSRGNASGVYLYRLVTDDTTIHKQMLLRK